MRRQYDMEDARLSQRIFLKKKNNKGRRVFVQTLSEPWSLCAKQRCVEFGGRGKKHCVATKKCVAQQLLVPCTEINSPHVYSVCSAACGNRIQASRPIPRVPKRETRFGDGGHVIR